MDVGGKCRVGEGACAYINGERLPILDVFLRVTCHVTISHLIRGLLLNVS